jgi:hypothetical protein
MTFSIAILKSDTQHKDIMALDTYAECRTVQQACYILSCPTWDSSVHIKLANFFSKKKHFCLSLPIAFN